MTALIIVLASALVLLFLYKFGRYVAGLYLVLCGIFFLSFLVMFFNLEFGATVAIWCAIIAASIFFLSLISAFVGILVSGFIIAPLSIIWMGFKGLMLNK